MSGKQLLDHLWVIGDSAKQDQMDAEIVSRLQSFNARRKLRAAAIASVWTSTVFLRTKKLKSLLGSHDLAQDEIENLRVHFSKLWVCKSNLYLGFLPAIDWCCKLQVSTEKNKWSHRQTIADKLHINTITVLNQYVQIPWQICAKGEE